MAPVLEIESLDLDGRGVARMDGKVVFVEGALPGERVQASIVQRKKSYDKGSLRQVLYPSALRIQPRCPHFGVCGGCAMQHVEPDAQVAIKQRVLEDNLQRLAEVTPRQILPAMYGPSWGYRYRARLSVRFVRKKGGVLVGFRERRSSYVADITECHVLPPHVSALLVPLRRLIETLSHPERIPQIEVAVGEEVVALVLRHLEPLSRNDTRLLEQFGQAHNVSWWLQPQGPDSVYPLLEGDEKRLYYRMPQFGLTMHYRPTDFTQVNHYINRNLVARALAQLDPQSDDIVADMFCGLGNFSLPLATLSKRVLGIEGAPELTQRAAELAHRHGLGANTEFRTRNLFDVTVDWLRSLGHIDRMLIDPPREGALELVKALAALSPSERPRRIVYVSCSPATLARDAGILAGSGGYSLHSAGVVNMFPHTGHIESLAVFG